MSRADQPRARNAVGVSQLSLLTWLKQSFTEQHQGKAEGESRARLESNVVNVMTKQCPSCLGYFLLLAAWRCGNESEACSGFAQVLPGGKTEMLLQDELEEEVQRSTQGMRSCWQCPLQGSGTLPF